MCETTCVHLFRVFFFQAEDGIRDLVRSRGLGDVYKRQRYVRAARRARRERGAADRRTSALMRSDDRAKRVHLSLIHI